MKTSRSRLGCASWHIWEAKGRLGQHPGSVQGWDLNTALCSDPLKCSEPAPKALGAGAGSGSQLRVPERSGAVGAPLPPAGPGFWVVWGLVVKNPRGCAPRRDPSAEGILRAAPGNPVGPSRFGTPLHTQLLQGCVPKKGTPNSPGSCSVPQGCAGGD